MKDHIKGGLIFTAVIIIAFAVGSHIMSAAFFGTVTLLGLVVLIESMPLLKWLVTKSSKLIDIMIFVFTIALMANSGITATAALTIAGVGYTLVYAPYLRAQRTEQRSNKQVSNKSRKFNSKIDRS